MAITGSGTQADPWIVHDISEIRSTISQSGKYLKLANDIDCNDYGSAFTWATLSSNANFDLDGHAIKNIEIPKNNYFSSGSSGLIHNGKILNVYINGSPGFSANTKFQNMSISIDATAQITSSGGEMVFRGAQTQINQCAIYVKNAKNAVISAANNVSTLVDVVESDLYIDNVDVDSTGARDSGNWMTLLGTNLTNCRVRGKIRKFNGTAIIRGATTNCVIDLDIPSATLSNAFVGGTKTNTPVNTETLPTVSSSFLSSFIKCTTAEIRNGDSLRSKGFLVVNVVGD